MESQIVIIIASVLSWSLLIKLIVGLLVWVDLGMRARKRLQDCLGWHQVARTYHVFPGLISHVV